MLLEMKVCFFVVDVCFTINDGRMSIILIALHLTAVTLQHRHVTEEKDASASR